MSNKIKTKLKKKDLLLTREDFKNTVAGTKIDTLDRMFHTELYTFRIKAALYNKGAISAKGFLFNDSIYKLPLGKKNGKGEILIDDDILKLFDRFQLAEEFVEKGDTFTGFLVDHDDIFYTVFEDRKEGKEMSENEYIMAFNDAYVRTSTLLLNYKVSNKIDNDEKLSTSLIMWTDKQEKPIEI